MILLAIGFLYTKGTCLWAFLMSFLKAFICSGEYTRGLIILENLDILVKKRI